MGPYYGSLGRVGDIVVIEGSQGEEPIVSTLDV